MPHAQLVAEGASFNLVRMHAMILSWVWPHAHMHAMILSWVWLLMRMHAMLLV